MVSIHDNEQLFVRQIDWVFAWDHAMDVLGVNARKMDIGYVENLHQWKQIEQSMVDEKPINNDD